MTDQEQLEPKAVKTDLINYETFRQYTIVKPNSTNLLNFSDWAQREQIQLLRSINGKLNFYMFFFILSLILLFLGGFLR